MSIILAKANKADCTWDMDLQTMAEAHSKSLLRYCSAILRDYHEAQDVVQSTFLKALSKRNTIKGDLAPWLYRTAYNNCIDLLRRRKWQRFFMEEHDSAAIYHMEDCMSEEIKKALGVLTPEDRALVISRALDDLDYEQLSLIYDANPAALRKRYERAKRKLAKALREQGLEVAYGKA